MEDNSMQYASVIATFLVLIGLAQFASVAFGNGSKSISHFSWGALAIAAAAVVILIARYDRSAGIRGMHLETAARQRREVEQLAVRKKQLTSRIDEVDQMSGTEFEQYVAAILVSEGFAVRPTAATGDYGVDLLAKRGTENIAIQCKRRGRPIGQDAIREAVAGARHYGCLTSMVVANQEFTAHARTLASANACVLVGRKALIDRADQANHTGH